MAVLFNEEEALFQRFLRLEKDRLNELVDSIFQSETSWTVVYGGGDNSIIEEEESTSDPSSPSNEPRQLIVCEAADRFSLLLLNLIDRSTYIPLSRYRLRIIHLLIDTVDDFCLRLSQVVHVYEERWPFTRKFYSLLNTFGYLLTLVGEWQNGGGSYFMQTLTENGQDLTVFSPTARTLQHMIEEIFERIENNIIADVTLDIIEYKKLNWHGMKLNIGEDEHQQQQQQQQPSLSISQAGATLVYHISMQLAALKRALSTDLFHSFLYDVAEKVQRLFFERIILEHYFNHDGARQLQYDIEKGLLAIFALYLKNTEYTFS
ncbi:PREDICTED: RAD50-interacting protein 1-like, partial [Rhagoletis zephyria]|uniref:RAD50-interacting protein 1-like n=1 Tax=Rhagoletis zephyria TaxID=28612 RepID=UPI0008112732